MKYLLLIIALFIPSALAAPITTDVTRVDTVRNQLKDTTLKVQNGVILPEPVVQEIRGKGYTQREYDQIKQEMAGKVRTFQNATSTTDEERAIIFDLLNQQCAGKPIDNFILNTENTNGFVADRLEKGC